MITTIVLDAVFIVFIVAWLVFLAPFAALAIAAAAKLVLISIQGLRNICVFCGIRAAPYGRQRGFDTQFLRDVGIRL